MEINASLISEIMNAVRQTDVYNDMMLSDPYILETDERCQRGIDRVKQYGVPADLLEELDEAITAYTTSYVDTAILYGVHLSKAIRCISESPVELARCLAGEAV